jgi:hypothetical protein
MKKKSKITTVTFLLVLMHVVFFVSPVLAQVKSDYDKDTDFTKYKTYTFAGWQKDCEKQLTEFDQKRITDALKAEFENRGLTLVDKMGDAKVSIYIVLQKETSTTAYTDYTGGLGYGPRWGWGAGMGSATTTYSQNDYTVGTLVVDMYDEDSKKLVWQGVIQSTVKEKPKQREKSIPKNIRKLMRDFPVNPKK